MQSTGPPQVPRTESPEDRNAAFVSDDRWPDRHWANAVKHETHLAAAGEDQKSQGSMDGFVGENLNTGNHGFFFRMFP